ncbi:hypothetical protein R5R35_004239 [Gryllus longicercus]|uniref:Cytochrome-b5 reductase n=1 Tax=Gryllus longicercus TaxID=2509291 RepID=A0AAN9WLG3_9ORTH
MPWCGRCCPHSVAAGAVAADEDGEGGEDAQRDAPSAGNPRNKVALQPGHSLMDWIRLGASGRVDLTGVGGRPRDVSPEQLAQHASRGDCWLALRGRVYNVTHYMDFHPGGAEELLRGAGRDATDLFNQVHAWVNYESILQKCVVGRLRRDSQGASDELRAALANSRASLGRMLPPLAPPAPPAPDQAAPAAAEEEEERKQKEAVPGAATQAVAEVGAPRMDWFQQSGALSLVWYAGAARPGWPAARVRLEEGGRALAVALLVPPPSPSPPALPPPPAGAPPSPLVRGAPRRHLRRFAWRRRLAHPVAWPPTHVQRANGKLQVTFRKESAGVWAELGEAAEEEDGEEAAGRRGGGRYEASRVLASLPVTPSTRLLVLRDARRRRLDVPGLGHHVLARALVQGIEVSRRYTPIPPYLHSDFKPDGWEPDCLCLMVKGYPNGALSHHITSLKEGDTLDISEMDGDFDPQILIGAKRLCLLAAGTGITPMLGIIDWVLRQPSCSPDHVLLVCFNRTPEERMWADQLSLTAEQSGGRFQIEHVLSNAGPEWEGRRGHVEITLLRELLPPPGPGVFVSACGPPGFLDASRSIIEEMGYPANLCHLFEG